MKANGTPVVAAAWMAHHIDKHANQALHTADKHDASVVLRNYSSVVAVLPQQTDLENAAGHASRMKYHQAAYPLGWGTRVQIVVTFPFERNAAVELGPLLLKENFAVARTRTVGNFLRSLDDGSTFHQACPLVELPVYPV